MNIKPRGAGFQATVTIDGKRYRKTLPSIADAKAWIHKMKSGQWHSHKEVVTLHKILKDTIALHWSGTRNEDSAIANALDCVEALGDPRVLLVSSVTSSSVQTLIRIFKARGLANSTINRKLAALSKILGTAVDAEMISHKPKIPVLVEPEGRSRFLSHAEELRLFRPLSFDYRCFCTWLVETGMRVSEALNLEWSDLIQDGKSVLVRKTKTDRPRTIPLTSTAAELPMGTEKPWDHITQSKLTKQWNKAKAIAGLYEEEIVPHCLRHTCASRLIQSGVGLVTVKEWMGHKSLETTLRYAHLGTKMLHEARTALEHRRIDHRNRRVHLA